MSKRKDTLELEEALAKDTREKRIYMDINKPGESITILKGMTKAFIHELTEQCTTIPDFSKTNKEVSSSTMEQMKKMCEDDNNLKDEFH